MTDIVLTELFYVLRSKGFDRWQASKYIGSLYELPIFIFNSESIATLLLEIIKQTNPDFADCYLITRAMRAKEQLVTFDKKMLKTYERYVVKN